MFDANNLTYWDLIWAIPLGLIVVLPQMIVIAIHNNCCKGRDDDSL